MAVISCKSKAIATNGELECIVSKKKNGKINVKANFEISVNVYNSIRDMLARGTSLAKAAAAAVMDECLTQNQIHGTYARVYGSRMVTSDGVILN